MAKKKADIPGSRPVKGKLTSFRFSEEFDRMIDQMAADFDLTKAAILEAGGRMMFKALYKANIKEAINSLKESKKANLGS